MSCKGSFWSEVSDGAGTIAFLTSFVSLMPQIIETYRDKTVEGLSPYFLLAWLLGDITSIAGAILTDQLLFQVLLAIYFLTNDSLVCAQYYYYGIIHKNKLATPSHEPQPVLVQRIRSRANSLDSAVAVMALASQLSTVSAYPLSSQSVRVGTDFGRASSWLGASFYVGARLPQLIKNYQRKSTDGLSPFLFATTLLSNVMYNVSIFTSCKFLEISAPAQRMQFIMNAAPFILGSAGTIFFDLIYFYQHYFLYAADNKLRQLELQLGSDENTPLISRIDSADSQRNE